MRQDFVRRLVDRFEFIPIEKESGPVLEIGAQAGPVLELPYVADVYVASDLSPDILLANPARLRVCFDEEHLGFDSESFQCVLSAGFLHYVNDWLAFLREVYRILKPGGLFLANFWGGRTLWELSSAFAHAHTGFSVHVGPFCRLEDITSLLRMVPFSSVVVDADVVVVSYDSPLDLMSALRSAGQVNAAVSRRRGLTGSGVMVRVTDYYQEQYGRNGRVPATFEIFTITVRR